MPSRRRGRGAGAASSDEEDDAAPAKASRTLKRMMRQTGLEDSEEEGERRQCRGALVWVEGGPAGQWGMLGCV